MTPISFTVRDLELVNTGNSRTHWGAKQRRAKAERAAVRHAACQVAPLYLPPGQYTKQNPAWLHLRWKTPPAPPLKVTLTRVVGYRGRFFDDDGLVASMKAVRDSVAQLLGCDDGPKSGIAWAYEQRRSGGPWLVQIDIDSIAADVTAEEGGIA